MFRTILLTTALVAPSQLWAQATPERATQIAAELSRFLPGDASGLKVEASGADYLVTVDFVALAKKQAERGLTLEATPFTLHLTEEAGGTYAVSYDQPFTAKAVYRKEFDADFSIGRISGTGQFDPALGAFTTHEMTYSDISYRQAYGEAKELGSVVYKLDEVTSTSAARANPAGGIDVDASYKGTGLVEDLNMLNPATGEMMDVNITGASYDGSMTFTGSRALPLLDLVGFVVENFPPSPNAPDQQKGLKEKLRAAAPFFDTMKLDSTIGDLSVGTVVGTFAAKSATVTAEANGAVDDGRFYEHISLDGLTLPEGLLPAWAAPLVPADASIGFDFGGFNLAAPLGIVLDQVDFAAGPTSEQEDALQAAILPEGTVGIDFTLGADASGTYELESSGSFLVGPEVMPSGKARVSLAGIDAILTALNGAPDEIKGGAIPGISMIRGLGKADGDATVWEIELTEGGGLFVNGNDMSMFMQ